MRPRIRIPNDEPESWEPRKPGPDDRADPNAPPQPEPQLHDLEPIEVRGSGDERTRG